MDCPKCSEPGELIGEFRTHTPYSKFFIKDEHGEIQHEHDPNRYVSRYECRNKHVWTVVRCRKCEICGWVRSPESISFES